MAQKIKVVQCGLGFAGASLIRSMLLKRTVECVGAVDKYNGVGRDVGDVLGLGTETGIRVTDDIDEAVGGSKPDVWIEATQSKIVDIYPRVKKALSSGINVITLAEEFANPWYFEPELTKEIDAIAKKNNVTMVGTGFNPGLWLDVWPFFLSGCVYHIDKIKIQYMSDLSPYGRSPDVVKNYGFGLKPAEIEGSLKNGSDKSSKGTIGIIHNLAGCLGFELSDVRVRVRPLISTVRQDFSPVVVIEPGEIHGSMVDAYGICNGKEIIEIHKGACCKPSLEVPGFGEEPHTEAVIEIVGEPNLKSSLSLKSENGWSTTAPRLLNWIPFIMKAKPGLLTDLRDFPLMGAIY
ncbi:MAG: hypothetical protein HKM93_17645 [Desulfobacteraceae bacterium]|nr:hypothetical protein [Desulfobacteraceae bacterium]